MSISKQKVQEFLDDFMAGDNELFIVDVAVSDSAVRPKITIMADGDNGITIEQCASISRRLAKRLEEFYGEDASFVLEVTSPGVDFPLTSRRQFERNVGRKLKLQLKNGTEKIGTLEEVTENGIMLAEEQKVKTKITTLPAAEVTFDEIEKTNIVISFK